DRAVRLRLVQRFGETARISDEVVRIAIGFGWNLDQIRAREADHVFLFLRLRLGNDDDGAKPHRRADESEPDAGVARRSLDDDSAGTKLARRDRMANDRKRGAILHRLARIHE